MKKLYKSYNIKDIKLNLINWVIILSVVSIFVMMFIFPLLGDDLLHGKVGIGIEFMSGVNGRYLGNLFGINLSSSIILRILIKTIVFLGIVYLIKRISKEKNSLYYLLILSLLLFMPKEIFRQVIVNSSGFGNYVVPVIGILIIVYMHLNVAKAADKYYYHIIFLSLGLINSLFVEHVTIFNILLAIYINIFNFVKNKKLSKMYVFYLVGTIIGSYLMFSNPIYLSSFNGTDNYRSLSTTLNNIYMKFSTIVYEAFYINYILNFILSILVINLIKKQIISKKNCFQKTSFFLIIFFSLFQLLRILNPSWQIFTEYRIENYFTCFIAILYFAVVFINIFLSSLTKNEKYRLLFYMACYMVVLSPLLLVNPIGPRCYFIGYVFLILLIVDLIKLVDSKKILNKIGVIRFVIPIVIVIQFIFYFTIYGRIYLESEKRIDYIRNEIQKGNKEVNFTALPFPDYLHGVEICPEYNEIVFRIHYNIDEDIIFVKDGC